MKKAIVSSCLLLLAAAAIFSQDAARRFKYYRLDQVMTLKGEITEIKNEECYRNNNFMVIYVKRPAAAADDAAALYRVELAPDWYYNVELMKGSSIEVTGSYTKTKEENLIIARSIIFQGELYRFRDKNGFPLWQGKRRQMRQGSKGRMRRKGNR